MTILLLVPALVGVPVRVPEPESKEAHVGRLEI